MQTDFYVYVYFRPDGSPCYVGKGRGNRWLHHEQKRKCSNPRLAGIISRAGGSLPKIKLREGLTNAVACKIEIAFIAVIGRWHKGPLVNMTDGGEGLGGVPMPAEIKRKISKANKGRRCTAEHRANLSKSRKALFAKRKAEGVETRLTPEHRRSISAGGTGKRMSDESRAKMSAAKKGRPCGPIQRQRLTEYARNKTPEHRAKLSAMCHARNIGVAIALGNSEGF